MAVRNEVHGSLSNRTSGVTQVGSVATPHIYGPLVPAAGTTGTNTTGIANDVWVTEVFIPCNCTITGISFLIGGTGGTDKAVAQIWNAAGTLLGNSDVAGVTVGTLNTFQRLPLAVAVAAVGPGRYFVGIGTNGTTAKLQTQVSGDSLTTSVTQVFGTPATLTPIPTTFTTNLGPIVMLY